MPDYQGNSKKSKGEDQPEKKVERVTTGEVLLQKKSLGGKFKDLFVAADFKSVTHYVVYDVFIPALRNMIVDGASRGVERMMYGDRAVQRGYRASHITYNNPIRRGINSLPMRDNLDRTGLPSRTGPMQPISSSGRAGSTSLVMATKEEADSILEHMTDILDQYQVVTVGDLFNLAGLQSTHVDEKWGWEDIRGAQVQQIREGYLLDLPQPQPLQ